MPTKWDRFRGVLGRAHDDFEFPTCEFQNFTQTGITNGNVDGQYESIGSIDCEFVPPGSDSSVDVEGTHLDFTISIIVPDEDLDELDEGLVEYGDDNERPTKVIPQVEQNVGYELQAIEPADGSGFRRLRLTED